MVSTALLKTTLLNSRLLDRITAHMARTLLSREAPSFRFKNSPVSPLILYQRHVQPRRFLRTPIIDFLEDQGLFLFLHEKF